MSVLKYRDPVTGQWEKACGKVKVIGGAAEELLKSVDLPDYVKVEAAEVAARVREVLTKDSIVSVCMSDSHYPAPASTYGEEGTRKSGLHAAMAAKALAYLLPVDFMAHLGDVAYEGSEESNTAQLKANLETMLGYFREAAASLPMFVAIGNHDPGDYVTPDDQTDLVNGKYLYEHFTALSDSANTVTSGKEAGGYCYRDFPDKQLRVFLLNTSEEIITGGKYNDKGTSTTQRAWVAEQLLALNEKTDAANWKFIVLCHYPLDYGASKTLSNVFEAYVNGSSITLNGTAYAFGGKNAARFLVQFHGHIHNFLVDKLYGGSVSSYTNGVPTEQYNVRRMCIPNSQFDRENYYYDTSSGSKDGTLWGIKFFEGSFDVKGADMAQKKVFGTADDTSLVVNVINPSEEKIYSFCYGAGYDRAIGIGNTVYYSITTNATNATVSGGASSVEAGKSYSATVAAASGYELDTVKVTMGGVDITSTAYADGAITIAEVTGNVVITVTTLEKVNYTNLVRTSIDTDGSIYNGGLGYKNGYRLGGSGAETEYTYANVAVTGYIELPTDGKSHVLRLGGTGVKWDEYGCQMCIYNDDFSFRTAINYEQFTQNNTGWGTWDSTEDTAFTLTWNVTAGQAGQHFALGRYIRISATRGGGANMIVTIDEPIA